MLNMDVEKFPKDYYRLMMWDARERKRCRRLGIPFKSLLYSYPPPIELTDWESLARSHNWLPPTTNNGYHNQHKRRNPIPEDPTDWEAMARYHGWRSNPPMVFEEKPTNNTKKRHKKRKDK